MRKWYQPDLTIKYSIVKKLRRTVNEETVRWLDNAHSGMGKNVSEMRKSLSRGSTEETLVYIKDMKMGAVTMLAALEVMEERLTPAESKENTRSRRRNIFREPPGHPSMLQMLG